MPMPDAAIADLEKLIKKARQADLPFGLCLGKKPEDNVLVLHLKKSPEVLMRQAKAEGETAKLTYGTCGVKGKVMSLRLEGKMLPGLAKNMKAFMTKIGIKMKVVILDADGTELESDGDDIVEEYDANVAAGLEAPVEIDASDEEENETAPPDAAASETPAAAQDAPADSAATDGQAEKWARLNATVDPRVRAFAQSGDAKAPAIVKAWEAGQAAAAQGNYKVALAVAAKIAPVVSASPDAKAPDPAAPNAAADEPAKAEAENPDAAKWARLEAPLTDLFERVMRLNPPDATRLRAAWGMATESAESGDFAKAITIATRLKPMLDEALKSGVSEQAQDIPADVVPFQKSKLAWESARKKMNDEIGALVGAIQEVCAGDEELKEVAASASDLPRRLNVFEDRLDDALNAIINAPQGPAREQAKALAVSVIGEFQGLLAEPFFQDVDSKNGFKPVKVTETAVKSLDAIARILAAQPKTAA